MLAQISDIQQTDDELQKAQKGLEKAEKHAESIRAKHKQCLATIEQLKQKITSLETLRKKLDQQVGKSEAEVAAIKQPEGQTQLESDEDVPQLPQLKDELQSRQIRWQALISELQSSKDELLSANELCEGIEENLQIYELALLRTKVEIQVRELKRLQYVTSESARSSEDSQAVILRQFDAASSNATATTAVTVASAAAASAANGTVRDTARLANVS